MAGRRPHIVLVGAGHAHLYCAKNAKKLLRAGGRVVLINDGSFWYSGMASGLLSEQYTPEDDIIDPAGVARMGGVEYMADRVISLDLQEKTIVLESRGDISCDIASFNIGSVVRGDTIEGAHEHAFFIKPIKNIRDIHKRLCERIANKDAPQHQITIIGGGPSACEIAANIDTLARKNETHFPIRMIYDGPILTPHLPIGAARTLVTALGQSNIELHPLRRVCMVGEKEVVTERGEKFSSSTTIVATGLYAPLWLNEIGLSTRPYSGIQVNAYLQSQNYPFIFGAGDCIDFLSRPLPRLGVFGVRQAPILLDNLCAYTQGKPLKPYKPQKQYLSILNLGSGPALAYRGKHWFYSPLAKRLKGWIDKRFMRQYQ